MQRHKKICLILLMFLGCCLDIPSVSAASIPISLTPLSVIHNPCSRYSLINSVDFHPHKNIFCATFTHTNEVILYNINPDGHAYIIQRLTNPLARLSEPQHAVFLPSGEQLIVANWTNQTLTVYQSASNDLFYPTPIAIIPFPGGLAAYKPHGIAVSPCGNFLAIAFGASSIYGKAIALYRVGANQTSFQLLHALEGIGAIPGIPKGITFTPDGTCLLVTFSDTNSLVVYQIDAETHTIVPVQTIQGSETGIYRPEDVKISSDGNFCALTNSDHHTITFYPFNKETNRVMSAVPFYTLHGEGFNFCFPHGIAFSKDRTYFVVTEFGSIISTKEGGITWKKKMDARQAKIKIFSLCR